MFWSAESENVLEELVTVVRILKLVIRTISGIKKLIPPFKIDNTLDPAEIYRHITWSDYFRNVATMERSGFADLIILLFKLSLLFRTFVREVNSTVYNPEHPSAAIEALGAEMERLKKEPYAYTTFDKAAKKRDKKKRSRKGKNEKYKEAGVERKKKAEEARQIQEAWTGQASSRCAWRCCHGCRRRGEIEQSRYRWCLEVKESKDGKTRTTIWWVTAWAWEM
ncbi:hypothetical protein C8F01DRAFT_1371975 [Mycena amicta]|nr:hypothetical protein C8F01DRAFT_1371975 [Mycena amicta]